MGVTMRIERVLLACVCLLTILSSATDCHGKTWQVPLDAPSIQAGLDSASAGDTVLVSYGTYYEYGLEMTSGVTLLSETGEADCVTIDATNAVQHYVIGCVSCDSDTRIEGFTMINGSKEYDAGGVFCHLSDMTFTNCVIANNTCTQRGGGMYIWDCSPTISHCTFYGNSAPWAAGGGGICCNNASPTIENTIIAFNTDGGAVTCKFGGSPTLICCDVFGNSEGDWVDCIAGQEGTDGNFSADPLFCNREGGDYSLKCGSPCLAASGCGLVGALGPGDCPQTWHVPSEVPTIQAGLDAACAGDTVVVECGAYYEYGLEMTSGVVLRSETGQASCVTIDATNVVQHYVIGCVDCDNSTKIEGFTMINGSKEYDAGGVFCYRSDMTFTNCVIANNTCTQRGGGMYIWDCSPTISHCTFYGNSAPWAAGGGGICCNNASPTIENTIIAFNTDGGAVTCKFGGSPTLICCDVFGNSEGDWVDCIAGQEGTDGNFSADPLFCEPITLYFGVFDHSPCMPPFHPYGYDCGSHIGAEGEPCPSSIQPTSWGAIKAIYR